MAAVIRISSELIVEAMQSETVRQALEARARRIHVAAQAIDTEDQYGLRLVSGTCPQGRPYSRVEAEADQEWGTSRQDRVRLLGTARNA